ncbi:MAG: hypothetical protein SPL08_04355 [Pseudomonadota bacterium]|nr:hypothetical protein [Pseudomonadota bacterium]
MKTRKQTETLTILESDYPHRHRWWQNKFLWISVGFSLIWIAFMVNYMVKSGWWQSRFDLTLWELIGGLGGMSMPMVFFWLICAYFDRTDRLESEAETLKSYLNELVYPTEEGAIYTRTLTDALRAQIKEFRTVFQEVNEETQAVRDDLKHWVRDLSAVIKHANTKTVASIREIARHIQNISASTELANKQAEQTSALFSEQAAILERVVEGTVRSTQALSQSLNGNALEIQKLLQEVNTVNVQTAQVLAKSDQVMVSLGQNGSKIEESINLYENSARQQNARLFGNLEKVLSVFRAHGDLLEQEVDRTTNRLTGLENALKTQASATFNAADKAITKVDETTLSIGNMKAEMKEALDAFKAEAAIVIGQIDKAGKKLGKSPAVHHIRTEDLLQKATEILSRLQTYSVDMAHLFSPKAEENLWERYYNGDKTVFMRHIKSELSPAKYKKLIELYQSDTEFHDSVDKYMSAFEEMTQSLDKGDDSKLLMSVVIGSDVGRLYMVLANILKGKK